jgi:hypothetical protein
MGPATNLLRQVHPDFFQEGHISSMAFRPTPKDEGRLSVYDGDQIEPEPSWLHYTKTLGYQSAGVWAITCAEVDQCALTSQADPAPFKEHVVIDFSECSKKQIRDKAKQLAAMAEARGCLFSAPT